jgi:hypothetical protein
MRLRFLVIVLAACGDNEPCAPATEPLPAGKYDNPYAMPLPDNCIDGGLVDMPGRWFMSDPDQAFDYWYPRFEGSCGRGFRQSLLRPDDHDASDGTTLYTWADGTIYFERAEDTSARWIFARAYCALSSRSLAGAAVEDFTGNTTTWSFTGTRFVRDETPADGLTLVGQISSDTSGAAMLPLDLAIDGGFAYLAGQSGLDVIDVSAPAAPVAVGHYPGSFNDVVIVHGDGRTVAYLAPFNGQHTEIVDVTDPTAPAPSGEIHDYSHTLFVAGTHLYLATYSNNIPVFDVTHPLVPVLVGSTTVPGPLAGVHDMFVDGDRIYANNTTAGLVAFDVSGGLDHPIELAHLPTSYSHTSVAGVAGGRPIVLHGDEGMTPSDGAAFLRVLDGDPSSPTFQSRPDVSIHNFQLVSDRLYIAYYQQGVRVVDLSDPTNPREVAHYNTWDPITAPGDAFEGALGIEVVGNLVYVADDLRGLVILGL